MIGVNNDGVFADQVQGEAEGVDIAFRDVGEWSAFEWITEDNLAHRISQFVYEDLGVKLLTTAAILAETSALTIA